MTRVNNTHLGVILRCPLLEEDDWDVPMLANAARSRADRQYYHEGVFVSPVIDSCLVSCQEDECDTTTVNYIRDT
jgi:hypothetical protein